MTTDLPMHPVFAPRELVTARSLIALAGLAVSAGTQSPPSNGAGDVARGRHMVIEGTRANLGALAQDADRDAPEIR